MNKPEASVNAGVTGIIGCSGVAGACMSDSVKLSTTELELLRDKGPGCTGGRRAVRSEDEVCSDAFPHEAWEDDEGNVIPGLFAIASKMVPKGGDVEIYAAGEFDNADEEGDESVEKVNNIEDTFMLVELMDTPKKKDLKGVFQPIIKKLRKRLVKANGGKDGGGKDSAPVKAFEAEAVAVLKYFLSKNKELTMYMGSKMEADNSAPIFAIYKGANSTPHFIYWSAAYRAENV